MARIQRQVQHRVEKSSVNKEMAELKRENGQLKRKIAKLQKQLNRAVEGLAFLENDDTIVSNPLPPPVMVQLCGNCDLAKAEDIVRVQTPTGVIVVCKKCGWRKMDKKQGT